MSTLSRFITQIGLSLAGVAGLAALGEPLPLPEPATRLEVLADDLRVSVVAEVAAAKQAAVAEAVVLRQTASRIRWLITSPGAVAKPMRLRNVTAETKIVPNPANDTV